jgi:thioester reductase-like protein
LKVLVSGGTDLLGQGFLHVLQEPGDRGVRCFVRKTSPVERLGEAERLCGIGMVG